MKEKKKEELKEDDIKENSDFYYEVVGIINILISITIFSELGSIGRAFKLFLKILFGDWYFLFATYLLLYGIYILWKRNFIDYKAKRIVGFYIFLINILVMSHYPIKEHVSYYSNNQILGTWELIMLNIKNYDDKIIMGGGLVGAVFFYIFAFLLGDVGVTLISIILLLISISFIFNKTINEIYYSFRKTVYGVFKSFINVKQFIKNNPIYNSNLKVKSKKLSINVLSDSLLNTNNGFQKKIVLDNSRGLHNVFKFNNINNELLSINIGNITTRYTYKFQNINNTNQLIESIKKVIEDISIIKRKDEILQIEEFNRFKSDICLKKVLLEQKKIFKEKLKIPIGLGLNGLLLELDLNSNSNILIYCNKKKIISNFIFCIVTILYIKNSKHDFNIELYDSKKNIYNLSKIKSIKKVSLSFENYILKLGKEIEEKLERINYLECDSYLDYNKKIVNKRLDFDVIKLKIIVLNDFDFEMKQKFNNRILFLLKIGKICGYKFIIINNTFLNIKNIIISQIDKSIIFKASKDVSNQLIKCDYASFLYERGEYLYNSDNKLTRCQSPYLSESEIKNITNKINIIN